MCFSLVCRHAAEGFQLLKRLFVHLLGLTLLEVDGLLLLVQFLFLLLILVLQALQISLSLVELLFALTETIFCLLLFFLLFLHHFLVFEFECNELLFRFDVLVFLDHLGLFLCFADDADAGVSEEQIGNAEAQQERDGSGYDKCCVGHILSLV